MPTAFHTSRGFVVRLALTGIAVAALTLTGVVGSAERGTGHRNAVLLPGPAEVAACIVRVGMGPESLCVAGANPQQTATLVTAARNFLVDHVQRLRDVDEAQSVAAQNRDQLARLVASGTGTAADLNALRTARVSLEDAVGRREQVLAELAAAMNANLPQEVRTKLATIRANRGRVGPTQYLVVNRTEADWVRLRDALAADRIAARLGESRSAWVTQLLAAADADPAVVAARTNLVNNLEPVTAAWNQALTP